MSHPTTGTPLFHTVPHPIDVGRAGGGWGPERKAQAAPVFASRAAASGVAGWRGEKLCGVDTVRSVVVADGRRDAEGDVMCFPRAFAMDEMVGFMYVGIVGAGGGGVDVTGGGCYVRAAGVCVCVASETRKKVGIVVSRVVYLIQWAIQRLISSGAGVSSISCLLGLRASRHGGPGGVL